VNGQPTPYRELASVIASLPVLLREARRARGLSLRAAAKQLGMSFSTVTRIEAGEDCALSNATAVLKWLDQTAPEPVLDQRTGDG
jgi:ribosome-binding protein aMBF1 (putative translation factor)